MKMVAVCSFQTLLQKTTWYHNPNDYYMNTYCRENVRTYMTKKMSTRVTVTRQPQNLS